MVGLSKNFSRPISRTNVRMHANADIWRIRQIEVEKEAKMMRMRTMELVTRRRVMMEVKGRTATVETRIRRKTILRTSRTITKAPVPVPATRTMISMIFTRMLSERHT